MRLLLFGATGGIGSAVRAQASAAGHELVLFARDPRKLEPLGPGEVAVEGDIGEPSTVEHAVTPALDAVLSALGPTSNSADQVELYEGFARTLVKAMDEAGVRRLIAISGAGCTVPGERKPLFGRAASAIVRLAVRNVVEAKQRELEVIVASDLEWTLPRPARVVDGARTDAYRVGSEATGMRVTQGDVADFMVRAAIDGTHVREAPLISS